MIEELWPLIRPKIGKCRPVGRSEGAGIARQQWQLQLNIALLVITSCQPSATTYQPASVTWPAPDIQWAALFVTFLPHVQTVAAGDLSLRKRG